MAQKPTLVSEAAQLRALGQLRETYETRRLGPTSVFARGRECLDFTSWDFLGLSNAPAVTRAVQLEIESVGLSSSGSRLGTGTVPSHTACEARLAQFFGVDRALLFASRNQAAFSLITTFVNEQDRLLVDELLQSPVSDAAHLVGAEVLHISSDDIGSIERALSASALRGGRTYIVLDAISPTTGGVPPLEAIMALAEQHKAPVIIDESWAIGVSGLRGASSGENPLLSRALFALYGALTAAVPLYGAFVAGPAALTEILLSRSRTFALEAALPPAFAAGVEAALSKIELLSTERERLRLLSARLRRGLVELGYLLSFGSDTPIVCIPFQKSRTATECESALFQRGILAECIPIRRTLSDGAAVRFLVRSVHSENEVDRLLQTLADLKNRVVAADPKA